MKRMVLLHTQTKKMGRVRGRNWEEKFHCTHTEEKKERKKMIIVLVHTDRRKKGREYREGFYCTHTRRKREE